MEQKLSWFSLAPHLTNLRIGGIYQLDPKTTSEFEFGAHQIYMRICLFIPVLYTMQEIIYIYQVRADADRVMDSMFLMLSFADLIYKQVVFWLKADKIEKLLDTMKGPVFNQNDPQHKDILMATVNRARRVLRVFNSMTVATTFLWTTFPLIAYLNNQEVDFAIWLPFDAYNGPQFYGVLVYVWIQTTLLGLNDSTMDSFISFSYAQARTQITVLRTDLETMVERARVLSTKMLTSFSESFDILFKRVLVHHKEIVRFSDSLQDIFGGSLLFQLLVTEWIICTSAYRAVNMKVLSIEFLSMVFYLTCIMIEIYLYCFNGNEVTYESDMLLDAAYNMNWLKIPLKQRQSLVIFMERIKKPIKPVAAIIVELSLGTFIWILRGSYSFYAFLKTTDHQEASQ